ncbi:MAG: hypothetical protein LIO86_15220 [Lachnospiraceae bacterium]|nr:hypothetical protein [Lachnospiraceae bacterium]
MEEMKCVQEPQSKIAALKNSNCSLHTLSLMASIPPDVVQEIKEKLILTCESKRKGYYEETCGSKTKCVKFTIAPEFGFNEIILKSFKKNGLRRYWLYIKINPRRMNHAQDHPYVYIASPEDIQKSIDQIQLFLDEAEITEIPASAFHVQRVDYCVNIDLGNADRVKEYMRLMQKGAPPHSMKRLYEYSKSGKRYVPMANCYTVISTYAEFSVYDKQYQLSNEENKYSQDEIREASGMIRIEYRAKRQNVRNIEKQNGCETMNAILNITPEMSEKYILRYLKKIYGTGKFVKMWEALQIIDESPYKKKTKKEMENILRIAAKTDLEVAKQSYGKEFSKYMRKFNELGISPITIERRAPIESMENPSYYIAHQSKNHEMLG